SSLTPTGPPGPSPGFQARGPSGSTSRRIRWTSARWYESGCWFANGTGKGGAVIIQGTGVSGEHRDRADVVVVGTGAGGATLADYLAARGWDVVMVERGGFFRAEDFSQLEDEALPAFNGRRG